MSENISIDPDVIGGKPRVKGTRVSVNQIYEMYKIQEMSPEEIADILPTVDKDEVREAIKYAKENNMSVEQSSKRLVSKS